MDRVRVFRAGHTAIVIELKAAQLTIGRTHDADLRLDDPHVNRVHARLIRRDSTFWIEDMQSTWGTYVDGVKLLPGAACELRNGAVVRIGEFELSFELEDGNPGSLVE